MQWYDHFITALLSAVTVALFVWFVFKEVVKQSIGFGFRRINARLGQAAKERARIAKETADERARIAKEAADERARIAKETAALQRILVQDAVDRKATEDELRLRAAFDQQLKLYDRYAKAAEHLGDASQPVRIGGIYELGLILASPMKETAGEHTGLQNGGPAREVLGSLGKEFYWPVMDLLTSFIRNQVESRSQQPPPVTESSAERIEEDIQAALNVIGRRAQVQNRPHDSPIDLSGLNLSHAWFAGLQLQWSYFGGATLDDSNLDEADFREALLDNANLRFCSFIGTNFDHSILKKSNLSQSNFEETNFSGANLSDTDLSGSVFPKADFAGANLSGADLSDTDLGAAKNLEQIQINSAVGKNPGTTLPPGRTYPAHW
jgi:hypothetical protein